MTGVSTFKGGVSVSSTPRGYSVRWDPGTETEAHDLGHAVAAIITAYTNVIRKTHPCADLKEVTKAVLDGIECGLKHNPEPMRDH